MIISKELENIYKYKLPFGYYRDNNSIEVSMHNRENIRAVFVDYIQCKKLKDVIAKHEFLKKKTMLDSYEFLRSMISNSKYKGVYIHKGVHFPFPAIVTEEIWKQAQEKREKNVRTNKTDLDFEITSNSTVKTKRNRIVFENFSSTKHKIAKIAIDTVANHLNTASREVAEQYKLSIFHAESDTAYYVFSKKGVLFSNELLRDKLFRFISGDEINNSNLLYIKDVNFVEKNSKTIREYKVTRILNEIAKKKEIIDKISKVKLNELEIAYQVYDTSISLEINDIEDLLYLRSKEIKTIIVCFVQDVSKVTTRISNILETNKILLIETNEYDRKIAEVIMDGGRYEKS